MSKLVKDAIKKTCEEWQIRSFYERFEQIAALILTVVISIVLLIALLVLTCKFTILDPAQLSTGKIGAFAGAVLALGVLYWLMRRHDDRLDARDEGYPDASGGAS